MSKDISVNESIKDIPPADSKSQHISEFSYIAWGAIWALVILIPLFLIYKYLTHDRKKSTREKRRLERLAKRLERISSETESEDAEAADKKKPRKESRKGKHRKGKGESNSPEDISRARAYKERSTISLQNREMRKARTPSFFERQNTRKYPIVRICFTGGPCAGKTTAMAHCADQLRQLGIKSYIVPEAVTILRKGGISAAGSEKDPEKALKFQINLLKLQMSLEDTLMEIGSDFFPEDKVVILCDMGTMDASVTLDKNSWNVLLDETGWTDVQLRDKRYDLVIHMVTAADGAEEYFKRENSEARSEDVEDALKMDRRTRQAWVGHPSF